MDPGQQPPSPRKKANGKRLVSAPGTGLSLALLASVLLLGAAWVLHGVFFSTQYYINPYLDGAVDVLCNDEEAFIVVEKGFNGRTGTVASLVKKDFMGIWGYRRPANERREQVVVHIKGDQREIVELTQVGLSVAVFPFQGNIYFEGSPNNGEYGDHPELWKWERNHLVKVDQKQASAITRSFQYLSDIIAKEGWKEHNLPFSDSNAPVAIKLNSESCLLTLQQAWQGEIQVRTVTIKSDKLFNPELLVAQATNISRHVSKDEYFKCFGDGGDK